MVKTESNPNPRSNPSVLILMPLFNESQFVASAIESVIAQTYTNWVLLAQDNFSSDSTPEVVKHFSELDSRIIFRQNTQFLTATLNWITLYEYAFQNLDFEYICFLAGDDYWSTGKFLQSSMNELIMNPFQSVSVPVFLVEYHNETRESRHSISIRGLDSKKRIFDYLKYWDNANLLYAVYRADYFEVKMKHSLTKFSDYKGSDWWWGLGIALDQELIANDKMVYVKRVSPIRAPGDEIFLAISNLKEKLIFIIDHFINERHRFEDLSTTEKIRIASFTVKSWWSQTIKALIHLSSTILKSNKRE